MDQNEVQSKRSKKISNALWYLVEFQERTEETTNTFKGFIGNGADINFVNLSENSNTLLHLAVLHEKNKWLQLLVDSGAYRNIRNDDGKTAIDLAVETMYQEGLKILRKDADTLIRDLNTELQVYDNLKSSKIYFNYHSCEIFDKYENIFIKCSHPEMLLAGFAVNLRCEGSCNLDSNHIFMKLSQVNSENLEMIRQAIASSKTAKIFLIDSNSACYSETLKSLNAESRIVLISSHDNELETVFPINLDLDLNWNHLTTASQQNFLNSCSLQFQGNEVKLTEIMDRSAKILADMTLEDVFNKIPGMNLAPKEATSSRLEFYVPRKVTLKYSSPQPQTLTEESFVSQIGSQKGVYVLQASSSGKTTWAKKIAELFTQKHNNRWVVFIDFKKITDLPKLQAQRDNLFNLVKCQDDFERRMFKHFLHTGKVFFILNGVTKETLITIIPEEIMEAPSNNTFLLLKKDKGIFPADIYMKFEPLDVEEQMAILKMARCTKAAKNLKNESIEELEKMLKNLKKHFGEHFATPGYCLLLNEVYADVLLPQNLNLKKLITLIVLKKAQLMSLSFRTKSEELKLVESLISMHHAVALRKLFDSIKLTNLDLVDIDHQYDNLIESIGFIMIPKPLPKNSFVTPAMTDFFAADFILSNAINPSPLNSSCFLHDLFLEVLVTSKYRNVRYFMNELLDTKDPNEPIVTEELSKKLDESLLDETNHVIIKNMVIEQLSGLLKLLLKDCDYDASTKVKLLTHKDEDEKTALNQAICSNSVDFQKNFFKAIETIPRFDYAKCLLSDDPRVNLFAEVVSRCSDDVTKLVIELAMESLESEDLKKFILGSSSLLLLMVAFRSVETLKLVWQALTPLMNNEELMALFWDQEKKQTVFLQLAVASVESGICECILELAKSVFDLDKLRDCLLMTDRNGRNALHQAILTSNVSNVEMVLKVYQSNFDSESMKAVLLSESGNILQFAVARPNVIAAVVDKIVMTAVEVLSPEELRSFVTAKDNDDQTLLHIAADRIEVFAVIWQLVSNIMSPDEQTDFMLQKNLSGFNFFSSAFVNRKSSVALESLEREKFFSSILTEHEITLLSELEQVSHAVGKIDWILENPQKISVFLARNNGTGDHIFHLALRFCKSQVLTQLFEAIEMNLTKKEIFWLANLKNEFKRISSLGFALDNAEEKAVFDFWNFLTSVLSNEECIQIVLSSCDNVFHEIALANPKFSLKIVDWFNINCGDPSVHTKIYCERDSDQRTLIHVVAQHFGKDLIEQFFTFVKRILKKEQLQTMLLTKGANDQNCFKYLGKNTKPGTFDAFLDNIKMVLSPEDLEKLVLEGDDE